LVAVFIDDGLRREGEPEFVVRTLKSLGIKTKFIDAKAEFFAVFKGRQTLKRSGRLSETNSTRHWAKPPREEQIEFIAQGTIKADVIETVGE